MAVTLRFELLRAESNQFFLEDLVLMGDASGFLLCLVALCTHRLHILLQVHGALLKDLHLLTSRVLVIVELMHFVIVHLDVTCQIGAPSLVNADLFSELRTLHLELANSVLCPRQFHLFLFDKLIGGLDLVVDGGVIALHRTLQVDSL